MRSTEHPNLREDPVEAEDIEEAADAVASPTIQALEAFDRALAEFRPYRAIVLGCAPSHEVAAALREATKALIAAQAVTTFEFTWKLRSLVLVGTYAALKRRFPSGGAAAGAAFDDVWRKLGILPNWVIGGALCHWLRPAWINNLDMPPNRDARFVLDALREAGPTAQASVAADVERLGRAAA